MRCWRQCEIPLQGRVSGDGVIRRVLAEAAGRRGGGALEGDFLDLAGTVMVVQQL